jgi:NRAMP (natural resistance-associated macrophage protein)-like metal ion transporter
MLRALGLGLITGAADDDPSAIGTYASAGAKLGYSFLWTAPLTFPMMVAVVYLSSKLGQVTGKGLFDVIRDHYPRWILQSALVGVLVGNTIEAGADIGGMAAAAGILVPLPRALIVVATTVLILSLQIWGSYQLIRNIFRWLALALLAYVASAVLAKPDLTQVLKGTLVPRLAFNGESLSMLVAVIGTTLSAYLYTWQSNQEVEEEIAMGRRRLADRKGATREELRQTRWDIVFGMLFSNIIMYFIILSTASTLFEHGQTNVETAADAARAATLRRQRRRSPVRDWRARGRVPCGSGDDHRRGVRPVPDARVEARPPCEAGGSQKVLSRDRGVHPRRDVHELRGVQPDARARLRRNRTGILHPALDAADHADHLQPAHHGPGGERMGNHDPRLGDDRRDLRREHRSGVDVDCVIRATRHRGAVLSGPRSL